MRLGVITDDTDSPATYFSSCRAWFTLWNMECDVLDAIFGKPEPGDPGPRFIDVGKCREREVCTLKI
eukprot:589332-Amphidinium_carterae.3